VLKLNRVHEQPLSAEEAARAVRIRLTHAERVKTRLVAMLPEGPVAIVLPDRRHSPLRDGTVLAGEDDALAIVEAARGRGLRVDFVARVRLDRLAAGAPHNGCAARCGRCQRASYTPLPMSKRCWLVCTDWLVRSKRKGKRPNPEPDLAS